MSKITVAAVQLRNRPGNKGEAYSTAEHLLELATKEGAQLVILPELSCCGYIPNQEIWQHAESIDGSSVRWAASLAKKMGVFIGAGFAEDDGGDYYNSYFIANPQGQVDGIVRKANPESYCFRPFSGENVITSALGRIGVGICADNHSYKFLNRMKASNPDLMLMPHAWPMPFKVGGAVAQKDIAAAREDAFALGRTYAEQLNAATVFVNAVGPLPPMTGLLGKFMTAESFHLGGYTHIVDAKGETLGSLAEEEGYIVSEISLSAARVEKACPVRYGDWLHPGSAIVRRLILPWDVYRGRRTYRRNQARFRSNHPPEPAQ